jgi:hypothetical protein
MPEWLHARLRKEAKLNARSVNGEINHRLEQSFLRERYADFVRHTIDEALATPDKREAVGRLTSLTNFFQDLAPDTEPKPRGLLGPHLKSQRRQPTEPKPTTGTDESKEEGK